MKQLVALVLGLTVFLVIGWALRDLERMKKIRNLAFLGGIGFLLITLVFGQEYYGAKKLAGHRPAVSAAVGICKGMLCMCRRGHNG